ncbi:calcium-binding protein [Solicola sp. PLA-1-18]|uniref:calcium-binding protein n=1 Tax=Solicola sp. PLA-1-18 TaxID=3380532 RepID=UPI003B822224
MRAEHVQPPGVRATSVATVLLSVVTGGLLLVAMAPGPAQAVTRTSSGVTCTIVGTTGRDVLKGTSRRDVICGRGGNDVINGRGGNDVIDGGAGKDKVTGGAGNDTLIGGPGRDRLAGSAGRDRLAGGSGGDTLAGGTGDDRAVDGGPGDDELSGGAGSDHVDGGPGFNLCDHPSAAGDRKVRCATDKSAPVVRELRLSRTSVDVSSAAQRIRVRVRLTDDTGVKRVQIGPTHPYLASGTARDGIWTAVVVVPRYIKPGARDIDISVTDRVGRHSSVSRFGAYTVRNTVVDRAMPVVRSLRLSASTVDVRKAGTSVTATVRVTDDLAGASYLALCPAHAYPTQTPSFRQAGACASMSRKSGSARDSVWKGRLEVPKGSTGGTWNVEVWIDDAAGNSGNDFWFGPDGYAALREHGPITEPRHRALPGGAGRFTVRGAPHDTHAPVLTSLRMSPSTVDTSDGAKRVTVDLAGRDVEGITSVWLHVSGRPGRPEDQGSTDSIDIAWIDELTRVSGSARNGVWRATFVVPGGTPDGRYWIQASLQDRGYFESWVSGDSGWTTDNHVLTPALAPTGTHFVVANSG